MRYRTSIHDGAGFGLGGGLTPAVKGILIACVGAFLLQLLGRTANLPVTAIFGLSRGAVSDGWVWQLATYMFLHGGVFHLVFNMLVLWMFGSQLEASWGTRAFLRYFFVCGIAAGVTTWLIPLGPDVPTVGSSGAVYGLILAYGMLFPDSVVYLYFLFPIRAKYLALILGGVEFLSSLAQSGDGVAHFTHLGGLAAGYVYLRFGDRLRWWFRRPGGRPGGRRARVADIRQARATRSRQREEVDAILDKISSQGIDSLTPHERRRLREVGNHNEPAPPG